MSDKTKPVRTDRKKTLRRIWRRTCIMHWLGRLLSVVLVLALALMLLLHRLFLGPSPSVRSMLTMSLLESSALKFVPYIYMSREDVDEIVRKSTVQEPEAQTDASLINIPDPDQSADRGVSGTEPIELIEIKGATFKGYLLIVADPSRVFVGVAGDGYTAGRHLEFIVNKYGAVGGTNANGFEDKGGMGNGANPLGLVISEGKTMHNNQQQYAVAGFDKNNVLNVGHFSNAEIQQMELRDAVAYGPVLIVNGEAAHIESDSTGLNPRTAIGQRADGAVLLLVLDGRQADSLGAKYQDEIDIMLKYGAVNACNLDGGTSSAMYFEGRRVNGTAAITGTRAIPCALLVRSAENED